MGWCAGLTALRFRIVTLAVVLLAGFFTYGPANAQIAADLRAETEDGFARLVLGFENLPAYKIDGSTNVLVISFEEEVDVSLDGVEVGVPDYISIGRRDPNGRAIRFALVQPVSVNATEAGPDLYLDLLPKSWRGPAPSLPREVIRELAQRAEEAEERARLRLLRERMRTEAIDAEMRIGRLPTFTRLNFDWGDVVEAAVSREDDKIKIKFNRYGNIDLADLNVQPTPQIASAESELLEDGLQITLTVDPDAKLRAFREERSFIIDVSNGNFQTNLPTGEAVLPENLANNAQTQIDLSDSLADASSGENGAASISSQATKALTEFDVDDENLTDFDLDSNAVEPDEQFAPDSTIAENEILGDMDEAAAEQTDQVEEQLGDLNKVLVRTDLNENRLNLTFPFLDPVASATFTRANIVWTIFDTDLPIDVQSIRRVAGSRVSDITVTSGSGVQVVRIALANAALVSSNADETDWIVTIGDEIQVPTEPLKLVRGFREDGDHVVSTSIGDAGNVHWVTDPVVGDTISIVTAFGPPRGLVKQQRFVDFQVLSSAHGLVVVPITDVDVRIVADRAVVERDGGLVLTSGDLQLQNARRDSTSGGFKSAYVNFDGWRQNPDASLLEQIASLELAASRAPENEINGVRLAAARLMVANGFYTEAMGQISLVAANNDRITRDPTFKALRGVNNVLLGRASDARNDLTDKSLKNSPDTKLWMGMVEAHEGNYGEAQRLLTEGEEVMSSYPENIQSLFRFAAIDAAIQNGDIARASYHVEALRGFPLDPEARGQLDIAEGRLFEENRNTDDALAFFESAIASGIRPIVAEATWRHVDLASRTDRMEPKEAIERLENLIATWRGDDIELSAMLALAQVYIKDENPRRSFELLRSADAAHPSSPLTRDFHDAMSEAFADLFLKGGADDISPVKALALYYDFRALTPVGRDGDEMIRRLADRLISVDLLEQAAELLDHQINQRLRGAARAQVATQLALVHLMNQDASKALRVIQMTRQAVLPTVLRRKRTLLEAQGLAATDRIDLAMERLNSLEGDDVDRLRANLLWDSASWQLAGEQLERLLGTTWNAERPLTETQRTDILRAAISYSLADDNLGLDRLRRKFSEKMATSPDAASFEVVSSPFGDKGGQFRQMVRQIADTDTLSNFLTEYRQRYYPESLAETPQS